VRLQDGTQGWNLPEGIVGVEVGGLASNGVVLVENEQVYRGVVARVAKGGGFGLAECLTMARCWSKVRIFCSRKNKT
jgi:hypothetical protein